MDMKYDSCVKDIRTIVHCWPPLRTILSFIGAGQQDTVVKLRSSECSEHYILIPNSLCRSELLLCLKRVVTHELSLFQANGSGCLKFEREGLAGRQAHIFKILIIAWRNLAMATVHQLPGWSRTLESDRRRASFCTGQLLLSIKILRE